jgi:transglutaminase-like putative cysteine protease
MILRAVHKTLYSYSMPSIDSHNEVRLMPLSDENQTCLGFDLKIHPRTRVLSYDEPGGTVHYFGIRAAHPTLEIAAEAEVHTLIEDPFEGVNLITPDWAWIDEPHTKQTNAEFLVESPYIAFSADLREIAARARRNSDGIIAGFILNLSEWIHKSLRYDPDATHVHSKLDEVLTLRAGVCQDFAHLMIGCCRHVGLPARYVSGYLYVGGAVELKGEQATHAWVECRLPSGRWLAVDPTNNLLVNDRYIAVHTGRDYTDVTPTRGVYVGAPATSLDVTVQVDRLESSVPTSS